MNNYKYRIYCEPHRRYPLAIKAQFAASGFSHSYTSWRLNIGTLLVYTYRKT